MKKDDFTKWLVNSEQKKAEYREILQAQQWAKKKLRREAQKWDFRTISK